MRTILRVGSVGLAVFAGIQFIRPFIPTSGPQAQINVPPNIHQIIEKDCYSCHSNERHLAWFDDVQPAYWLVEKDIVNARNHLNFSTLGAKPEAAQKAALYEAVNMVQLGAMPLPRYLAVHHESRVTAQELAALKAYLAPWSALPAPKPAGAPAGSSNISQVVASVDLNAVRPELNGIAFDPTFVAWKPLSYTDRGDNNTFRIILGNDVAVRAAAQGKVLPWPDGARFAKIAWQQVQGEDGLVYPGAFIQVELMIKDSHKYASTDGWGWGRWRGLSLTPYGQDARFVNECTGCHQPVKGNDYVYTLPISAASVPGTEVLNQHAASLPKSLPYQPLSWTPITMYVDRKGHTMSTVFGNDRALFSYPRRANDSKAGTLGAGAVLAVVTWGQRDDPHWFGGRMPDVPATVEFVTVDGSDAPVYLRFDGQGLKNKSNSPDQGLLRAKEILRLRPAVLP